MSLPATARRVMPAATCKSKASLSHAHQPYSIPQRRWLGYKKCIWQQSRSIDRWHACWQPCQFFQQQHASCQMACAAVPIPVEHMSSSCIASIGMHSVPWVLELPVRGPWGVWAALVGAGAFGLWCEKNTRIGKELSGALMATVTGMAMANLGVLPPEPSELQVVYKFLLPLAIPMLLFSANLKRMLMETRRLLLAFLLGSVMTVVGSTVAMAVFPLSPYLGDAGWRIASALTARHIGGAVNYMAVSDMLQVPPSVFGAGLAADDLILTLYFTTIYTLAKVIPAEQMPATQSQQPQQPQQPQGASPQENPEPASAFESHDMPAVDFHVGTVQADSAGDGNVSPQQTAALQPATTAGGAIQPDAAPAQSAGPAKGIQVLEGLMALALSAAVCYISTTIAQQLSMPTQSLTLITGFTVALATLAPKQLAVLVPSAEGLAQILMQIFYATIGASANVALVVKTAPVLFCWSFLALAVHLGVLLWVGWLLGFTRKELLIASNANIGGPSTVAGMTAAKGWTSSIVPGILTSTLGYTIGTFIGMALGTHVLRLR